jgi:protein involved in polysaccharide export with SLBB domain
MTAHRTIVALALAGLIVSGCDGPRGVIENASLTAATNGPGTAYRLVPGDKVKVTVFNEPEHRLSADW